jgi:hypothetical protein
LTVFHGLKLDGVYDIAGEWNLWDSVCLLAKFPNIAPFDGTAGVEWHDACLLGIELFGL